MDTVLDLSARALLLTLCGALAALSGAAVYHHRPWLLPACIATYLALVALTD